MRSTRINELSPQLAAGRVHFDLGISLAIDVCEYPDSGKLASCLAERYSSDPLRLITTKGRESSRRDGPMKFFTRHPPGSPS